MMDHVEFTEEQPSPWAIVAAIVLLATFVFCCAVMR
jgi:hypothetical protein